VKVNGTAVSIYIDSLLDEHSLIAVQDSLSKPSLFGDGKATAGVMAERVKSNLQADKHAPELIAAQKLVEKFLLANPACHTVNTLTKQ
jgi:predicted 2-oxoglutarate/Fe(II)-dependent dioxygenase YbiX